MKRIAFLIVAALSIGDASAQYALQFGSAVAVGEDLVVVGEGRNLLLPGNAYVYRPDPHGAFLLSATLSAGGDASDGFGKALAAQGQTIVVGAPGASSVYVFSLTDGGEWSQTAVLRSEQPTFGSTVAFSPGHLLVGAPGGRNEPGMVQAFTSMDGFDWAPSGEFEAPEPAPGDGYGRVLAIRDDRAAIGAPGVDARQGMVQVLSFEDGAWTQTSTLHHPDPQDGNGFGSALVVAGEHIGVGVPGTGSRNGSVISFKHDADEDEWSFDGRLTAFDATSGEGFGSSIAFGNSRVLVGAPGYGAREGAIYLFSPTESGRMSSTELHQPDDVHYRSGYGQALAASGRYAVVGAAGQDNFEGAAFVYTAADGQWGEPQMLTHDSGKFDSVTGPMTACEEDAAGAFPCADVDMLSFMSRDDVGARRGIQMNDVWGWEDPETGREYALVGRTDGTSFIDLTDPNNPVFLGDLPKTSTANQSLWRDIKVYRDHAYIVSDGAGAHHMQIFDLRQLRDVTMPPVEFQETAIYDGIYSSHNIVINEESGFAYAVGSDSGGESCGGALHMIDLSDPVNPTFAGCFADLRTGRGGTGTTHDAQCVTYHGPDSDYQSREICLSSNGTALSIADVTDKANPTAIAIADYPNVAYAHQGWLTEDHRYFYLNDEGDEGSGVVDATRTMIFDLTDLDDPVLAGEYFADNNAIDHNLYVKDNLMYQTNYIAGLRIIDISDRENPTEVGFFDTVPYGDNDNSPVLGAWSSYPFFKSGVIVVTSGREGVFFLKKKNVDT